MSSQAADGITGMAIRRLLRRTSRGGLGTLKDGAPYVSLVMLAYDQRCCPLLLLSDLADHTRNLEQDRRASLLVDGTLDEAMPLTGERITLQGVVERVEDESLEGRYLARHPDAAVYAQFKDFHFYRLVPESGHVVAGFGKIAWKPAPDFLMEEADIAELRAAEQAIIQHMNEDHRDAVELYARVLLKRPERDWRLTGVDPDGCDLRSDTATVRLPFDETAKTAADIRAQFVRLAKRARAEVA